MVTIPPDPATEIARLEQRLREIDGERERITTHLAELRRQLAAAPTITVGRPGSPRTPAPAPSSSSEKVALFSSLFRGRADVYPRFWTNERKGTKGYSPACLNEWQRPICQKPRGGFGNLIPLPLQHEARKHGNTVFLGDDLEPLPDQWEFLAGVQRIPSASAELIAAEAQRQGRVLGVRFAPAEDEAAPWARLPSRRPRTPVAREPAPESVTCVRSNRFIVERDGLPAALVTELRRAASFQNPEFYKKLGRPALLVPRRSQEGHRRHRGREAQPDRPDRRGDDPEPRPERDRRSSTISSPITVTSSWTNVITSRPSFERALSEVKARYVLGLTATPARRDGHEPIIEMQLGPVRYAFTAKAAAAARGFQHRLRVRDTGFGSSWKAGEPIQQLYAAMAKDEARNAVVLDDAIGALEAGRSPLLLTASTTPAKGCRRDAVLFRTAKT